MSFNFSQSLLRDREFSSQENENSQDSGYAPESQPFRVTSNPPMFPPRRTLPRPPTWPTLAPQQTGARKWKFASNNQVGSRDQFERDMKQHLQELNLEVSKVMGKMGDVIRVSVDYLKRIYDKEVSSFDEKINEFKSGLNNISKTLDEYNAEFPRINEKIAALELLLSEVISRVEVLNKRNVSIEEKLLRLVKKVKEENESSKQLIEEFKLKGCDQIFASSANFRNNGRIPKPLPTPKRLPTVRMGNATLSCGIPRMISRRNDRCRIRTTIIHSDSESD